VADWLSRVVVEEVGAPLANKPDLAADKSPAKAIVFLKTCPASVSSKGNQMAHDSFRMTETEQVRSGFVC
jgi:hypothetical protein